ncbi:MAG: DUF2236 domain-containing protein [Proteobacteria bacterium]|nr:MAG: DUF2236 domain-containing protein [Pseudomonadota bacterium]
MMAAPAGLEFDFSQPRGEAPLVPVNSVSWRIFKNPVTLFIGGVAAVILELGEPSVRSGVWDHSSFQRDAVMRLRRTGAAAMMTVYGPRSAAEEMIARVVQMHGRVTGETPDGTSYHANDQRLLDWVQATASFGFIEAYSRFAHPLDRAEQSRAFAEGAQAARLYGAVGAPSSVTKWEAMLAAVEPTLERSGIVLEFLDIMRSAPALPLPLRPLQRVMVRAAVDIVPAPVRHRLGLGLEKAGLNAFQRRLVTLMARAADRLPLASAPPAQASMRMGQRPDYLYR